MECCQVSGCAKHFRIRHDFFFYMFCCIKKKTFVSCAEIHVVGTGMGTLISGVAGDCALGVIANSKKP